MPVNTLFAGIFIFAKQQKFQKYSRIKSLNRGSLLLTSKLPRSTIQIFDFQLVK